MLGFKPPRGSLLNYRNKYNYKFSNTDKSQIISWINNNLKVNWIKYSEDLDNIETELIKKYRPLVNISKNQFALKELRNLRDECRKIANNALNQ